MGFFKKNEVEEVKEESTEQQLPKETKTFIGDGTKILGNIETNSELIVNGILLGDIESNSSVTVGLLGVVKGTIRAREVKVSGEITGNLNADVVHLLNKCFVKGEIVSNNLKIEDGGNFSGNVKKMDVSLVDEIAHDDIIMEENDE